MEMNSAEEHLAVVNEEIAETQKYMKEPSFLTIIESAIANLDTKVEDLASLDNLIIAVAELETKDPRLMPKLFGEVMKIYLTNYPAEHKQIFY